MSIRIIDSCALSKEMVTGKGAETRVLTDGSTKWKEVSKYCIDSKKYLIVTPCVNDGFNKPNIPTDSNWQTLIYSTCLYLKSIGMRSYNGKVSIINEPTKFFRDSGGVARYAHFINLANPIIKQFGFRIGAGNMEFRDAELLGDWYRYICINAKFDDLDIHIQGSCDNEERIKKYTDYAKGLCNLYGKKPDCTEAFYGNIATSSGWSLINKQVYYAELIGCANFGNVFNDLRTNMFPILSDPKVLAKWTEISFMINGVPRSPYWESWQNLTESKAPVPNIKNELVRDGMIIKTIGHKTTDVQSGYSIELLHELLLYKKYIEDVENMLVYDTATRQAVESFQTDLGITVDGRVGRQAWRKFINSIEDSTDRQKFQFDFVVVMSPYNLDGDT